MICLSLNLISGVLLMNNVSNFLVKISCFCDYLPFVSSVTNLVALFQKYVVLPSMDKSKLESSHYYKHLDQKSFFRCFLLVIPIIGNIIIGIYDFSNMTCNIKAAKIMQLEIVEEVAPWDVSNAQSPLPEGWEKYTAQQEIVLDYMGGKITIPLGDNYFTYQGKVAIGFHGSYNPPTGM